MSFSHQPITELALIISRFRLVDKITLYLVLAQNITTVNDENKAGA
jgi:hypothetical protein